jgi:hypothetical protein
VFIEEMEQAYKFWWKNIEERIHLDYIGLNGRILLEWILDKQYEMV